MMPRYDQATAAQPAPALASLTSPITEAAIRSITAFP